MSLNEYLQKFPDRPKPVPIEFAGQWIAWDAEHRNIVANGKIMSEVLRQAIATGHTDPILQSVPLGPFIG